MQTKVVFVTCGVERRVMLDEDEVAIDRDEKVGQEAELVARLAAELVERRSLLNLFEEAVALVAALVEE